MADAQSLRDRLTNRAQTHCLLLLLFIALPATAACPVGSVTGEVTYVRDGDTIELGALAIRLNGVAAPEWDAGRPETTAAIKVLVLGSR